MITEMEQDLTDRLKKAFGQKVRQIDPMPTVSGAQLLARFRADAPAFYLAPMNGLIANDKAAHRWSLLAVARHADSPHSARVGDGQTIGLYQMVDNVISLATHGYLPGWQIDNYSFAYDDAFVEDGLQVCLLQLIVATDIDPLDEAVLANPESTLQSLLGITAFIDVQPFASDADRQAWLADNPGSSNPDITVNIPLEGS